MAELSEVSITVQESCSYTGTRTLLDSSGAAIDLTNALATGYIATDRSESGTLLETFNSKVCLPTSGISSFSLTASQVAALRPEDSVWPNDTDLTILIGYYYMDVTQRIPTDTAITGGSVADGTIIVAGNYTATVKAGGTVTISNGGAADGTYTVLCASYATGFTTIYVEEAIGTDPTGADLNSQYIRRIGQGEVYYERKTVNA